MEEDYDCWRIRELEDAWEMLTEAQKQEIAENSLCLQREAEEQRQAWLNMTPEQLAQVKKDIVQVFADHNRQMAAFLKDFANTKRVTR